MPPVEYRELRLCSNKGAFEALPSHPLVLDLSSVREALERRGREVTDARVMLIVPGTPELTIARDGRVLVKSRDAAAARAAFEGIRDLLVGR